MTAPHAVALLGFTPFERTTLEAFFRLAARRTPAYTRCDDAAQAQLVLVDADSPQALNDPFALCGRCIYIGAKGHPTQLAHMPRPLNMMALLRVLDGCVALTPPRATAAVPSAVPAAAPTVAPVPPLAPAAPAAPVASAVVPLRAPVIEEAAPTRSALADQILVVDDSDIALRFMVNCLGRFGFEVDLARSGEEALLRVASTHYAFVFMDVTMPGLDGYQTCKLIKKRPYPEGRRAPTVVMLTSRGGMVDKMRGTLSGCDAYLTKPLQHDALMKVIGDRIVADAAEADTRRDAATTL